MPVTKARVQYPLYISSAGTNDEAVISHDGSDLYVQNDTGTTRLGTTIANDVTVDHVNSRLGVGTTSPSYKIHAYASSGTSCRIVTELSGGATTYLNATAAAGFSGTISATEYRLATGGTARVYVDTSGNVTIPAAYTTVIGGTNTDLYIDNTGLLGPNPSAERFKENIREITDSETAWIYNVPVKICDLKTGEKNVLTVIAEDALPIKPEIVGMTACEILETGEAKAISRADYVNFPEVLEEIADGKERTVQLKFEKDTRSGFVTGYHSKKARLMPFTVNRSQLIYPILHQVQLQKQIISALLSRIETLENAAGIVPPVSTPLTEEKPGIIARLFGRG